MFELMDTHSQSAVIKVIGVGGGGGNAVAHMVDTGIEGVDFICANTDAQALKTSRVRTALQIGCNITKGLGAGADTNGPLAVAVIGGLVSSTLLTLVVVPALYSLVEHRVEAFRRRRAGAGRRAEAAGRRDHLDNEGPLGVDLRDHAIPPCFRRLPAAGIARARRDGHGLPRRADRAPLARSHTRCRRRLLLSRGHGGSGENCQGFLLYEIFA